MKGDVDVDVWTLIMFDVLINDVIATIITIDF